MNQQVSDNNQNDDGGIDLAQVVDFASENWKKAVAGAVAGALIGAGGWAVLGNYQAESVLVNNGALNFIGWRGLQKNLPLLAFQMLERKQVRPEDEATFKQMTDAKWWSKNVVPTYSLTKGDTKDLASISKDLQESGGTNILNLVVTAKGGSKESAVTHVTTATQFIKQGSAYLSIKNLVQGWDYQILNTEAALAKKITDTEVDLRYLKQRASNLESMRARFPSNVSASTQQLVDLKDSSAKFMPISTQLVAVNNDINSANESLERMQNELLQTKVMAEFVKQAKPIVEQSADGLQVVDQLLAVSQALRATMPASDVNAQQQLNSIDADLVGVRTNFQRSLDADLIPQVTRPGAMQPVVGGFAGGGLLALLAVLGRKGLAATRARAQAKG